MFYISGTTFILFQQNLFFSSLGFLIRNCPVVLLKKVVFLFEMVAGLLFEMRAA